MHTQVGCSQYWHMYAQFLFVQFATEKGAIRTKSTFLSEAVREEMANGARMPGHCTMFGSRVTKAGNRVITVRQTKNAGRNNMVPRNTLPSDSFPMDATT